MNSWWDSVKPDEIALKTIWIIRSVLTGFTGWEQMEKRNYQGNGLTPVAWKMAIKKLCFCVCVHIFIQLTLSDIQAHSSCANLCKCYFPYSCAAADKISNSHPASHCSPKELSLLTCHYDYCYDKHEIYFYFIKILYTYFGFKWPYTRPLKQNKQTILQRQYASLIA